MANLLTTLRLLLIAPVVYGLANPGSMPAYWLALLFLLAIVSDFFDGKVARATNTASARGMLFDHTTDFRNVDYVRIGISRRIKPSVANFSCHSV